MENIKVFSAEELKAARKEINRQYYLKNREKKILEAKIRYWNNPGYKKTRRISDWKRQGVKYFDYDILHELYEMVNTCDFCDTEFCEYDCRRKCLDHDHKTGEPRNILCSKCNLSRKD